MLSNEPWLRGGFTTRAAKTVAASSPFETGHRENRLEREQLLEAYRLMYLSRRIDDREIILKRQQKIYFQISGAGHEAIQIAAGLALRPGHDWFHLYYRDRALALALGITPEQMFLQGVAAARDTMSGGRQMPSHWSSPQLHIVSGSSPTGSQYLHAVGCAHAGRYLNPQLDEVSLVSSGDGATSEGEFWEAVNAACLEKLPVLFLIQDNGYAISVPVEKQTPGGNIARLLAGFPHLLRLECDGLDFVESWGTMMEAAAYCRGGLGPAIVRATCIRPYSHSLSDDEAHYKSSAERASEATRDPLLRFPVYLVRSGHATETELKDLRDSIDAALPRLVDEVLREAGPAASTIFHGLYSPDVDPTSSAFASDAPPEGNPVTMLDGINTTMVEEMARNHNIVVFGEDVADCSREQNLSEVKGKGGVFKVTLGLQTRFGSQRVFNTPIAEAAIVGRAIGMALRGLKPVVEIQFFDYIWPAMMQIRDELSNMRWRSNNEWACPIVIRVPIGGYLTGGSIYHSQSGESIFTHIPGLRVIFPSCADDAAGLLRTAIRCEDPVLFLEHKKLYRELYNRAPLRGPDYSVPFASARVRREGSRITVITYGAVVERAEVAARKLGDDVVEVIDLRSLQPYDWESIARSVRKTNRVIVAHEDNLSFGYGAEIAARIADELFTSLDAPVRRVAAKDVWVAYNPQLEDLILPQSQDLEKAIQDLLAW
jgi:2-oxoisovalerate dehydrogenase E1 component